MDGVFPAPMVIRSEAKQAGDDSEKVVGATGFEKRPMSAIMEDDEDADEEAAGEQGERDRKPNRNRQAKIQQVPEAAVRKQSVYQLPNGSPGCRPLVTRDNPLPVGGRCVLNFRVARSEWLHMGFSKRPVLEVNPDVHFKAR